jgi:hypothetical protein
VWARTALTFLSVDAAAPVGFFEKTTGFQSCSPIVLAKNSAYGREDDERLLALDRTLSDDNTSEALIVPLSVIRTCHSCATASVISSPHVATRGRVDWDWTSDLHVATASLTTSRLRNRRKGTACVIHVHLLLHALAALVLMIHSTTLVL